jgi:hypothetical protein
MRHALQHLLLFLPFLGVVFPRLIGTHHHQWDSLADVETTDAVAGQTLMIDTPGSPPIWTDPLSGPHDIISDIHTDTDTGDTPNDGDVLTYDTGDSKWHPVAPASAGYDTVENEGSPLTQRSTINFVGAGVTAADSGGVTTVTVAAGAGGVTAVRTYISFGDNSSGQAYTP